ncbi:MFS transporter [Streptomyces sp. NPDC006463]|uniref:MFS transporter n=1 Tax=Streptomyces sp. NPDC006463 TaxID=3364746 RepID=UPI0036B3838C
MFQSLSVRNFRLFATGQLLSVMCTWMMFVAQDWLVLSLSGDSATALGLVTAVQFTPTLLLTLYGGRLADRYDKRRLLILANLAAGLLALLLALVVLAGRASLPVILVFAGSLGAVSAVESPTRMSFVSELVGSELLPNASALSAAYFNTARILGPALAGLLISGSDSTGPVMLLNALSYLATVASLTMMRTKELQRTETAPGGARIADALRYIRGRPDLVMPLGLVAAVGMFGFNFALTLPLLAKTVFHSGSASFGLLTTAMAAGSLLGAFAGTARRGRPGPGLVIGAALAFGVLETASGLAPSYALAIPLLAATGFATISFAQAANHRIQLGSDPRYRGRVLALYTVILQGSTPLGALLVGWLCEHYGARSGLYTGGLVTVAAALTALYAHRRTRDRSSSGLPRDVEGAGRGLAGSDVRSRPTERRPRV